MVRNWRPASSSGVSRVIDNPLNLLSEIKLALNHYDGKPVSALFVLLWESEKTHSLSRTRKKTPRLLLILQSCLL